MDLVKIRRDLHQHPELGFTEFRTASKIIEVLRSLKIDFIYGREAMDENSRLGVPLPEIIEAAYQRALADGADPQILENMKGGNTAIIATIKGNTEGPTLGFRFDMDALPILESEDADHYPAKKGFASKYQGNMHACGHDGHISIGLGVAEKLADGQFAGTVKLIFQPAEEGVRGAYSIVQKEVLDDIDYLYCLHLGTGVKSGSFYASSNHFLASTKMKALFKGVTAHAGSTPEMGKNALLGAATALLNIHAIPRFSTGSSRVNVGVLEGGTAANIVPGEAVMIVETRAINAKTNNEIERRVRNIIEYSAKMHELDYKIEVIGKAIPIQADQELVDIALEASEKVPQLVHVGREMENSSAGSEDASFMIKRVQDNGGKGVYMIVGSDIPAPHHNSKFDIDENVLEPSVHLLEEIARLILQ